MPRYANRLGIVDTRRARSDARRVLGRLRVRTPSLNTPLTSLSGGNQQKVLIGRWLLSDPEILILDEPTRGIDVGAKFEIYTIINELAAQGKGIIMISSELPELIGESDRIVVMCRGRLTGIVDRAACRRGHRHAPGDRRPDDEPRSGAVSEWRRSADPAFDFDDRRCWPGSAEPGSGLSAWVTANAILVVLVALIIAIALYDTGFISANSVRNILQNSSTRLLVALGAGIVLISRGVDLSGGRMVGLAAVVSASMLQSETYSRLFFPDLPALPLILPIVVAVAMTTFLGAINGVVIAKLRPPFIATLGMMVIAFGMTAIYFDQPPTAPSRSRASATTSSTSAAASCRWVRSRSRSSSPSPARPRSYSGCCSRRRSSARTSTPSVATHRPPRSRA